MENLDNLVKETPQEQKEEKKLRFDPRFIQPWMPDLEPTAKLSFIERKKVFDDNPLLKKAFYAYAHAKKADTLRRKKEEITKLKEKAEDLVPQVMAQEMAAEYTDSNKPSASLLEKLKSFIDSGMALDDIKRKFFSRISEESWTNLKKYLFASKITQVEDLANMYESAFTKHKKIVEKRIRMIRKEIRKSKDKKSGVGPLISLLVNAENQLMQMERNRLSDYVSYGVVENNKDQDKSPPLHVHFNVPRPKQDEADRAKVIEPEVLDDGGREIEVGD